MDNLNYKLPGGIFSGDALQHIGENRAKMQGIVRPSMNYWQSAKIRFIQNKGAMFCMGVLLFYIVMAIVGPHMLPYDPNAVDASIADQPISKIHWFGTDTMGRDLWCRTWIGTRVSIIIGFVVAILTRLLGAIIGGISGYIGGKVDMVIMRVIDILYAIPYLIVVILLSVILGRGFSTLIVAMVFNGWLGTARLVRGQVLQLKTNEFVLAAKLLGASNARIITKHLIPNVMNLIIVSLIMSVPSAIFSEAFLSFLGLGVKPPDTSLGQLAVTGATAFRYYPWKFAVPSFLLCTIMLCLNVMGNGLRDALDPKQRS
ncbi:MAG TPA: ABC transporter permease [Clostridia bacterium]|nr:ABC transporter permease [Clostridia bacterium]